MSQSNRYSCANTSREDAFSGRMPWLARSGIVGSENEVLRGLSANRKSP